MLTTEGQSRGHSGVSPPGSFDDACASQPVSVGNALAVSQPRCLESRAGYWLKALGRFYFVLLWWGRS